MGRTQLKEGGDPWKGGVDLDGESSTLSHSVLAEARLDLHQWMISG
jgi:hypothetical protein